ncbi:MAG: outer membrane beta-barrel protein, partial [Ignavibacteriota bacterium]
MLLSCFFVGTSSAQDVEGRISFGFDAGGNKYYGNFTDNQFGLGGDLFIRWNILDVLSLHIAYNAGQIRYKAVPPELAAGPGTVNKIRYGGWELMASYNVFPDQTFVPYFIGGIEALNFEPKDENNISLPNNAAEAYSKNVLGGAIGVGFEMFITDKVTFNGKVLLH